MSMPPEDNDAIDAIDIADAVFLAHLQGWRGDTLSNKADTEGYSSAILPDSTEQVSLPPTPVETPEDKLEPTAQLLPIQPAPTNDVGHQGAASGRIRALATLPDREAFRTALNVFRTHPRAPAAIVDEAATVDEFVRREGQLAAAVLQPGARRWLSITLVVDSSASNRLWQQSIDEFETLLRRHGVFHQVRQLTLAGGTSATLTAPRRSSAPVQRPFDAARAVSRRNEILLVVSDFTAPGWRDGSYAALLRTWSRRQLVSLLHTLPARLWQRSWTGDADAMVRPCGTGELAAPLPALAGGQPALPGDIAIPLLAMTPASLRTWAKGLMHERSSIPAIWLGERGTLSVDASDGGNTVPADDAKLRILRFTMASSPPARRLARYMAVAAPLTFPVMRWVQRAVAPKSDASHLAEFVLGGLLEQVSGDADTAADSVIYDFLPEIRDQLQQGISINQAIDVLRTVGEFLQNFEGDTFDDRTGIATWPDGAPNASLHAFALVSENFLRRAGLAPQHKAAENAWNQEQRATPASEQSPTAGEAKATQGGAGDDLPAPHTVTPAPEVQPDSPPVATVSRTLREAAMDLQWSPTVPGLLAIQYLDGIEIWDSSGAERGQTILHRQEPAADTAAPLPLYWLDSDNPGGRRLSDPDEVIIIGRIATALDRQLGIPVEPIRLTDLKKLQEINEVGTPALCVVFGRDGGQRDLAQSYASGGAGNAQLDNLILSLQNVDFVAIQLDASPPLHAGISIRTSLTPQAHSEKSSAPATVVTRLADFVEQIRDLLRKRMSRQSHAPPTPNAMCWTADYFMALSYWRQGVLRIEEVDVRQASNLAGNWQRQRVLFEGSGSAALQMKWVAGAQLAWLDDDGNLRLAGRSLAHKRALLPLLSAGESYCAISGDDLGIDVFSASATDKGRRIVLPPLRADEKPKRNGGRYHGESIVDVHIDSKVIRAVTSLGFLHTQSMDRDLPENKQAPVNLHGNVVAACFSPDGETVCVLKSEGRIELWDTERHQLLDAVLLPRRVSGAQRPLLRLAPNLQSVVYASRRTLELLPLARRGASLAFNCKKIDLGRESILWVDDRPQNNTSERSMLTREGYTFRLVKTTIEALATLNRFQFGAIISDMGRVEGPREGYVLLDALRSRGDPTPFYIYAGSDSPQHQVEARQRGAQGTTNNIRVLLDMIRENG